MRQPLPLAVARQVPCAGVLLARHWNASCDQVRYEYRTGAADLCRSQVGAGMAAVELDCNKPGAGALPSWLCRHCYGAHADAGGGGDAQDANRSAQTFGPHYRRNRETLAQVKAELRHSGPCRYLASTPKTLKRNLAPDSEHGGLRMAYFVRRAEVALAL